MTSYLCDIATGADNDAALFLWQILTLKQEKARLLGFKNYAELSMASKVSSYFTVFVII
jgi:Zn-dependent oligopeptidase